MTNMTLAAQTIKDTISAQDVGHMLGLEIRHGRCKCPIHNGGDYNCVLYNGNRGFHCFSCGASGDVISLVQQYYKMSFKDCIAWFDSTFHMGLDLGAKIDPKKEEEAKKALQRRKNAIEFQAWKDRMQFDLALTAGEIVKKLEEARDSTVPKTYGEEWDPVFCAAVVTLPEARRFADECMMNCIKEKQT